jgi:hypothetical protein
LKGGSGNKDTPNLSANKQNTNLMARPKKTNCDYFPHDNGMRNNKKIKALRAKFGLDGYSIWCMILEYMTSCDFLQMKYDILELELLAGDFGCRSTMLNDIIHYCIDIGLLQTESGEELKSSDVIICSELSFRLQGVYDRRGTKKLLSTETEFLSTKTQFPSAIIPKLNKRKGKEIKGTEIKVNEINPFPDSVEFGKAWEEWEQYRKERRQKITPTTARHQAQFLSKYSEGEAIAIIRQSITNGWQGLFELKQQTNGKRTLKDSAGLINSYFESSSIEGA